MGYVLSAVARVLEQPTAWGAACEMALLAGPLWAAALVGLLLGWAWRPRWAAGIVFTADPPQFTTLEFWRGQLPARLRGPFDFFAGTTTDAALQRQQEEAETSFQGYVPSRLERCSVKCVPGSSWCGGCCGQTCVL
jgi:hypothetical protein